MAPVLRGQSACEDRALLSGETDSERVFALITRVIRRHGGDVAAGIGAAVSWIGTHLPVFALNFVVATEDELWALRYPETHELWLLEREAGGPHGCRQLEQTSRSGTMRVRSSDLASCDSVVLATERMDEHPGWRLLEPGELLRVPRTLRCSSLAPVVDPPAFPLTLAQLDSRAAASQTAEASPAPAGPRG